jgi:hypothetical protein
MPDPVILEHFIALVESNKHDEAIERFYADEATMQEDLLPPRRGKPALVDRERAVMARLARMQSRCVRPVFVSDDHVVIRWIFEFVGTDGTPFYRDELAYQRWECNKIVEERFYYDPGQAKPAGVAQPS